MGFYVIIVLFLYNTYNARKLRRKIHCRYTSISKQTYEKDVDAKSSSVYFEGKKFFIIPKCVKHKWYDAGLQWFSPMFMPEIDFIWNSEFPVDPNTGEPVVLTPEVAGIYREAESYQNYAGGQQTEMTKSGGSAKLSGLSKYLPWIAIAAVALVAVYFYTQNQSTQAALKVVELNLQKILVKIGGD
jgi:cell division protein FtsL